MNKKIVCIGGGHGLGHLLKTISSISHIDLTGVVTTTDNGGSTGRLRDSSDTIAWGDIRYCLSKLSPKTSIQSLLFEHRFDQLGELSGHSLGNLMFCAINDLCLRPTDSVKVMTKFLDIEAKILPMSDEATNLVSEGANNTRFVGEISVDSHIEKDIIGLSLEPMVKPSDEVILSMEQADILYLGPGSFFTSTLPSLLMEKVVDTLNHNANLKVYLFLNVKNEFNNYCDSVEFQLSFLRSIGIKQDIILIIPNHRREEIGSITTLCLYADLPEDNYGRHDNDALKHFLQNNIH